MIQPSRCNPSFTVVGTLLAQENAGDFLGVEFMRKVLQVAAIVAVAMSASAANAATVVNGSFELGRDPGIFSTEGVSSTAITGWTVGGFSVDYIGSYWQASDGVRSIDLSGLNAGSLSQTINTVIGSNYTITFDLSGNPDGGVGNRISVVSISGALPNVEIYEVGPGNSRGNMNWSTYSYNFTAFSTLSAVTFASAEFNSFGPALDNVSIIDNGGGIGSTVPEPASWAMLLVGFGFVGVASRRRGRRSVAA
jgi:choice-of-anchor C domain-containing protein